MWLQKPAILIIQICMSRVSETFLVKIADFGLSKDVYVENYYRESRKDKPKPVKWMAIESLREGLYDSYTEVVRYLYCL